MLTYKKSFRGILYYLLSFIIIAIAYTFYFIFLLRATDSLNREAYLLTAGVALILIVQSVVITTYFIRPATLIEVKDQQLIIYQSRKKNTTVDFLDVTGFGRFRQNLVVTLKNNKMFVIRFLANVETTQLELGDYLNTFINENSERYFDATTDEDEIKP